MPEEISKPWTPWGAWTVTLWEIHAGKFPHLPTIGHALRGIEPMPGLVRVFLAAMVEKGRIKKISKAKRRRLSAIATVLRGDGPVTEDDRSFLAECIDKGLFKYPAKGRPKSDILTEEINAMFLVYTHEHEKKLAEGGWIPKGANRLDHHLAGTPGEVALLRTALAAAEKGIVNKDGGPLDEEALEKRLTKARKLLGVDGMKDRGRRGEPE